MWRSWVAWMTMLGACALIAMLAWQNKGLRAQRDWLSDRIEYAYPGMYVPKIEIRDLDAAPITLGAPEHNLQVLFFFNETCPYCLKSAPRVAEAAKRMRVEFGDRIAMIGVCQCDPTQARNYKTAQGFDFPVVALQERRGLAMYRAKTVPLVLVIGRDGRVHHAIQEVFDSERHIEALLVALRSAEAVLAQPAASSDSDAGG